MRTSRNRLRPRGANALSKRFGAQGSFHQFLTSVPKTKKLLGFLDGKRGRAEFAIDSPF
jgi:hypothetical protein